MFGTTIRGHFLVHASKNVNKEKCESLDIDSNILDRGVILGIATLYDVEEYENRTEFERDNNKHFADSHFHIHLNPSILHAKKLEHISQHIFLEIPSSQIFALEQHEEISAKNELDKKSVAQSSTT